VRVFRSEYLVIVFLITLAGCQSAWPGGSPGTTVEYEIDAEPVEDLPENVTVINASDPRLATVGPIQNILAEAEREDQFQATEINESTYEQLRDVYADVPTYNSTNDPYTVTEAERIDATIFIRYNGTVYEVHLEEKNLG